MSLDETERIALQRWAKEPGAEIFISFVESELSKRRRTLDNQEMQPIHAVLSWEHGVNEGMRLVLDKLKGYKKHLKKIKK